MPVMWTSAAAAYLLGPAILPVFWVAAILGFALTVLLDSAGVVRAVGLAEESARRWRGQSFVLDSVADGDIRHSCNMAEHAVRVATIAACARDAPVARGHRGRRGRDRRRRAISRADLRPHGAGARVDADRGSARTGHARGDAPAAPRDGVVPRAGGAARGDRRLRDRQPVHAHAARDPEAAERHPHPERATPRGARRHAGRARSPPAPRHHRPDGGDGVPSGGSASRRHRHVRAPARPLGPGRAPRRARARGSHPDQRRARRTGSSRSSSASARIARSISTRTTSRRCSRSASPSAPRAPTRGASSWRCTRRPTSRSPSTSTR